MAYGKHKGPSGFEYDSPHGCNHDGSKTFEDAVRYASQSGEELQLYENTNKPTADRYHVIRCGHEEHYSKQWKLLARVKQVATFEWIKP